MAILDLSAAFDIVNKAVIISMLYKQYYTPTIEPKASAFILVTVNHGHTGV